jgi:hypothetical protein
MSDEPSKLAERFRDLALWRPTRAEEAAAARQRAKMEDEHSGRGGATQPRLPGV